MRGFKTLVGTGKTNLENALCCVSAKQAETQPSCVFSAFPWEKDEFLHWPAKSKRSIGPSTPALACPWHPWPTAVITPLLNALQHEAPLLFLDCGRQALHSLFPLPGTPFPRYLMISSLISFKSLLSSRLMNQVIPAHQAWIQHIVVTEADSAHCLEGLQGR